jgi:Zn-dependent peptidase ImmA (M78 family)/DNA-binding XRE family transcriptional regulator
VEILRVDERKPNPRMIEMARKASGQTQKALSEMLGIAQGQLSKIEKGLSSPDEATLNALSQALMRPLSFFYKDEYMRPTTTALHRKKQSSSKKQEDQLIAFANIVRMSVDSLLDAFELHGNVPRLDLDDYHGDPARVAKAIRYYWKMPMGPIQNLYQLLEDKGIFIFEFDFGTTKMDAFTLTGSTVPVIMLNKVFPLDRKRRTLAHELGHIVMHDLPGDNVEKEADLFANEFLLPEQDIREDLYRLNLKKAGMLKPWWRASMMSLIVRARELDIISDRSYKSLCVQMSRSGYRKVEPVALEQNNEKPTLFHDLIESHVKELGYSLESLSEITSLSTDEIFLLSRYRKGLHLAL